MDDRQGLSLVTSRWRVIVLRDRANIGSGEFNHGYKPIQHPVLLCVATEKTVRIMQDEKFWISEQRRSAASEGRPPADPLVGTVNLRPDGVAAMSRARTDQVPRRSGNRRFYVPGSWLSK